MPSHKNLFYSKGQLASKGEKRNEAIFDSTAAVALSRFAAILDSLLTPRTQTWHKLIPSDANLLRDRNVRLWFEEVNRTLFRYRYAPKANFASQNQANYLSLGAYGSGCLFIDKLREREPGIRYRDVHLSEVYFAENHQGIVDKAYRYFPMTVRQALQRWGDKLPEKIRETKNQETEFWFLHCVMPRSDYDPGRMDYKGMEFGSYYIAYDEKVLLEEGGFTSFPYSISRYMQCPGEVYGRSPAMDVLPAVKTLNEQKKVILAQGHRAVSPILLAPDDGVLDGFSLRPGALNSGGVTADGRPLVHALPVGNIAIGKDLMDDERALINDAFLITLFQILVETPQMTATEVLERTKEKGFLLAPTIGRQQSERLGPMIEREIDVLSSQRNPDGPGSLLPPMPELLREAKGDYRIEYESPLSRSQRAEEAVGFARSLETAIAAFNITQNPEILDFFDFDTAMPEMAEIHGMPLRWVKSAEMIQQAREMRAQQAQQQQVMQAAPGGAALMKAANQTIQGK